MKIEYFKRELEKIPSGSDIVYIQRDNQGVMFAIVYLDDGEGWGKYDRIDLGTSDEVGPSR